MIIRKYTISPAGRYDKVSLRHCTRRRRRGVLYTFDL